MSLLWQVVRFVLEMPVVCQRDFVCAELVGKLGTRYLWARASVEHPLCPPTHSHVRAKVNFGGWAVEPRGADSCSVTLLDSMDPADDKLPPMVARLGIDRCLQRMQRLKSVSCKKRAEHPMHAETQEDEEDFYEL